MEEDIDLGGNQGAEVYLPSFLATIHSGNFSAKKLNLFKN